MTLLLCLLKYGYLWHEYSSSVAALYSSYSICYKLTSCKCIVLSLGVRTFISIFKCILLSAADVLCIFVNRQPRFLPLIVGDFVIYNLGKHFLLPIRHQWKLLNWYCSEISCFVPCLLQSDYHYSIRLSILFRCLRVSGKKSSPRTKVLLT